VTSDNNVGCRGRHVPFFRLPRQVEQNLAVMRQERHFGLKFLVITAHLLLLMYICHCARRRWSE
jgi:hypothetical protein